jgi:hypothetical protein
VTAIAIVLFLLITVTVVTIGVVSLRQLLRGARMAGPQLAEQAAGEGLVPFRWGPSFMFPLPGDASSPPPADAQVSGWRFVREANVDAGMRYVGPRGVVTTTMIDPERGATMYGDSLPVTPIPTVLMVKDEAKAREQLKPLATIPCEVTFSAQSIAVSVLPPSRGLPWWATPVQLTTQAGSFKAQTGVVGSGGRRRVISSPIYMWQLCRPDGMVIGRVQSELTAYVRSDLDDVEFFLFVLVLLTGLRLLLMPPARDMFRASRVG